MKTLAWLVIASIGLIACGGGDDDPMTPTGDGGVATRDAAMRDAGLPTNEPCDSPGALETVSCGLCGSARRFCSSDGVWEYGPCEGEAGTCAPGESREASCGACGTQREVCTATCGWEAIGECSDEGECVPGELVRSREGCDRGQRDLRCDEACRFEPAGECSIDACESPGATEDVACGRCGTRTRFCTAGGEWEYGPCSEEGVCDPGTTSETTCGFCGTQALRCTDRCEWTGFGECSDAGECAPGTSTRRATGCDDGETRSYVCSDACEYEPEGRCEGGAVGGGLGEACVSGRCGAGLVCSNDTGVAICRRPCTDDTSCTGTYCLNGDAERTCSDACTLFTHAGCPTGAKCDFLGPADELGLTSITICSAVGTGTSGSRCTRNAQCARGFSCLIETGTSGSCTQVCDATHACPSPLTCNVGTGTGGLPFPIPGLGVGAGFCE